MVRTKATWLVAAAALLATGVPRPAQAHGYEDLLLPAIGVLILPSELGVEFPLRASARPPAPLIGWAYQLPLRKFEPGSTHRVAVEVDWLPGSAGPDVRGRLGYRQVRGPFEVGLGLAGDPDGLRFSPEVGLRLSRRELFNAHVLLRVEPALASPRDVRGVATLGWTVF